MYWWLRTRRLNILSSSWIEFPCPRNRCAKEYLQDTWHLQAELFKAVFPPKLIAKSCMMATKGKRFWSSRSWKNEFYCKITHFRWKKETKKRRTSFIPLYGIEKSYKTFLFLFTKTLYTDRHNRAPRRSVMVSKFARLDTLRMCVRSSRSTQKFGLVPHLTYE